MGYDEAAEMLLNKNAVLTVLLFLIAVAVLLVLAAQVVKACKELFGKQTEEEKATDELFEAHCKDSEERFRAGEKHIAENHDHIADLREGSRVMCYALMALLGHEMRTSNGEEMEAAQRELNRYLINRK